MTYQSIAYKVETGAHKWSCFECAKEHREFNPSTFQPVTVHNGVCDICKQHKPVGSAKKLFGYHKFI
jgi:hypothetical protein